jgi:hypothetical protein
MKPRANYKYMDTRMLIGLVMTFVILHFKFANLRGKAPCQNIRHTFVKHSRAATACAER